MASCDAKSVGIVTDINTVLLSASDVLFAISETNTWLEHASWRHFFSYPHNKRKGRNALKMCTYVNRRTLWVNVWFLYICVPVWAKEQSSRVLWCSCSVLALSLLSIHQCHVHGFVWCAWKQTQKVTMHLRLCLIRIPALISNTHRNMK